MILMVFINLYDSSPTEREMDSFQKICVSPDTYESLIPSFSITELQLCGHISLDQDMVHSLSLVEGQALILM